jgi:cytochrome P450
LTTTQSSTIPTWDAFDPTSQEYWEDPLRYYQPAHRQHPVFAWGARNTLVFLRYEDVVELAQDFERFSSHAMGSRANALPPDLRDRVTREQEEIVDAIMHNQLVASDPPLHTRQRRLAQAVFTKSRINGTHQQIEAIVDELIDELAADGSCDLMNRFAYRLSLRIAGEMLGLPRSDLPRFRDWITEFFILRGSLAADAATLAGRHDEIAAAFARVLDAYAYFLEWVVDRRTNPRDDLASAMAALREEDGAPSLSDQEVLAHMIGIVAAGTDTTANLIGNMVRYFTEWPELLAELEEDARRWPIAIEEGLRRSAGAPQIRRAATEDTVLGGVEVPAGASVIGAIAGANGDPRRFPDPLRFDLRRPNLDEHIAFGWGRHFCLGAALARPEAQIALRELYRRLPGLEADLDEPQEFVLHAGPRIRLRQTVRWAT